MYIVFDLCFYYINAFKKTKKPNNAVYLSFLYANLSVQTANINTLYHINTKLYLCLYKQLYYVNI